MSDLVIGTEVILLVNDGVADVAVGCATSISFDFTNELIGKTDVNAGLFRKKRVRISDCTGTVTGLTSLYNTSNTISPFWFLQEAIVRTEQALTFMFTDEGGFEKTITGQFLIKSVNLTGQSDPGFSEYTIEFEGTGGISLASSGSPASPGSPAECLDTFSDWWEPGNGATSFSGAGAEGRSFAGATIIEVIREAGPPLNFTAGTPIDRTYGYDGTTISIDATNPFNTDERVFVIWQA